MTGSVASRGLIVRLAGAFTVSEVGDGVAAVAVPLYVFHITGSTSLLGVSFAGAAFASLICGVVAGGSADHWDRRRVILAVLAVQAGADACIVAVPSVVLIVLCSVLIQGLAVISSAALEAIIAEVAGDRYQRVIGARNALNYGAGMLGPVLGGVLTATVGFRTAIAADGASFVVAWCLVALARGADRTGVVRGIDASTSAPGAQGQPGWARLVGAARVCRQDPIVWRLVVYSTIGGFILPFSLLAAIPFISVDLGGGSSGYGLCLSAFFCGSVVGSLVAGRLRIRRTARWFFGSALAYGGLGVCLSWSPSVLVFASLWALWGLVYAPEAVIGSVLLVKSSEDAWRGRLFAVSGVAYSVASGVGYGVAAAVVPVIGDRVATGCAGAAFALLAWAAFGRRSVWRMLNTAGGAA